VIDIKGICEKEGGLLPIQKWDGTEKKLRVSNAEGIEEERKNWKRAWI